MGYGYDLAGNMISETYPSGRMVVTAYDTAGRTSDVSRALTHYESSFSYAAHGGVTDVKLGNDLWEHTTYEPNRLQPTDIYLGTSSGGYDKLKLSYGYGTLATNNGNVMSQTITIPSGPTLTQAYTYDGVNRLKDAQENTGSSWKQTFLYSDQFGNRRIDATATVPSNLVGPNPQISSTTNRISPGQNYGYDNAGNLTSDPTTPVNGIVYDAENHQTQYTKSGQGANNYSYDGTGRRVKSITSSGALTTVFVYDAGGRLLGEYTNGTQGSGGTSYLTADALGSPRIVTDGNQSVKARHDYLPFGEEIGALGGRTAGQGYVADAVRVKFTGQLRDLESGLDYFGARYYASGTGRFTSADSVGGSALNPQTFNLYSYTINNPLRYVDPTGHDTMPYNYYDDPQQEAHEPVHIESPAQPEPSQPEPSQPQQPEQEPAHATRYLILVGEPGLGNYNVGTNFMRAAETRKQELESGGNEAIIVPVGSVTDVTNALLNSGQITGGVIFYGHGGLDRKNLMALFIGQGAGLDSNLDSSNVWRLDGRNLGPKAVIELNACDSGLAFQGRMPIAQAVADQLQRWTTGYDAGIKFTGQPGVYGHAEKPPSKGPLYMVPAPPGRHVGFNHYH